MAINAQADDEARAAAPTSGGGTAPEAHELVTAYVRMYARRKESRGIPFEVPEQCALLAMLYGSIGVRVESIVARAALLAEIEQLSHAVIASPDLSAQDWIGSIWATAYGSMPIERPPEQIHTIFGNAATREWQPKGTLEIGWRALFLASARPLLNWAERQAADAELATYITALERRCASLAADTANVPVHQASRVVITAFEVARAGYASLGAAAFDLAAQLARSWNPSTETPQSGSTHLAQFALAMDRAGLQDARDLAVGVIVERIDPERRLVRISVDDDRVDSSPWIPLAILTQVHDARPLELVFDPAAPPPPGLRIASVTASPHSLRYGFAVADGVAERSFQASELDALVSRIVRQRAGNYGKRLSARQKAHNVVALSYLMERASDEATAKDIEQLVKTLLTEILAEQETNGGWAYAQKNVPSYVYSATGRRETTFPDLQYTIDAAVPGIALSIGYARFREQRFLDGALRALGFFEETIRRIEWGGKPIWRLYPEDEKSLRMGTAVNYELWNGCFFAALSEVVADSDVETRLRSYIDDILAYANGHLHENGDIGYGDYVRELRTAYASWDAYLLAEIGTRCQIPVALEMARRIVLRLASLVLDSGAVPNVVDYKERIGRFERWSVHRHGIGPYPIRTTYQLYFVVAAALCGCAEDAALRALGFVLGDAYDELMLGLSGGYSGTGDADARSGIQAGDWFVTAVALLSTNSDFDYRFSTKTSYDTAERLDRAAAQTYGRLTALLEPSDVVAECDAAEACTLLYHQTHDSRWQDAAKHHLSTIAGDRAAGASDEERRRIRTTLARCGVIDRSGVPSETYALGADASWAARAQAAAHAVHAPAQDDIDRRVAGIVAGQLKTGFWPDGVTETQARILQALTDVAGAGYGSADLARALELGVRGAWKLLFDRKGHAFADEQRQSPMRVEHVACYAVVFANVDDLPKARAALNIVRQHRDAVGAYALYPRGEASADATAAVLRALAALRALPAVFEPDDAK